MPKCLHNSPNAAVAITEPHRCALDEWLEHDEDVLWLGAPDGTNIGIAIWRKRPWLVVSAGIAWATLIGLLGLVSVAGACAVVGQTLFVGGILGAFYAMETAARRKIWYVVTSRRIAVFYEADCELSRPLESIPFCRCDEDDSLVMEYGGEPLVSPWSLGMRWRNQASPQWRGLQFFRIAGASEVRRLILDAQKARCERRA